MRCAASRAAPTPRSAKSTRLPQRQRLRNRKKETAPKAPPGGRIASAFVRHLGRGRSLWPWVVEGRLWGSGIATEAVKALIEANPFGSKTIFAAVFHDNPASARVLTNLGFVYIGDAEYHSVARGAQVPTWTYVRKME